MRTRAAILSVCTCMIVPFTLPAQAPLTGNWLVTADFFGTPLYFHLKLAQHANTLTGDFDGDTLHGTVTGNTFHFLAKDTEGGTENVTGSVENGVISGTSIWTQGGDSAHPVTHRLTAVLPAQRRAVSPQRHDFTPVVFYRQFSALNKPVLTISPGDTVHTTTVDAGGTDATGLRRVLGGNPQTGPFYVETAMPGDVLVIHLTRVRLNRDWAISDDGIVPRGLDGDLAVKMKDTGKDVRWHLDLANGTAWPEKPGEHLTTYAVPLRPMMGCIAVAPSPSRAAPNTGDSGPWGGNMDFNEIVEGATVFLPVATPGALLYLGDGHAAQGDGELTGNALETSMDVEFTVDVIPAKRIPGPRVESPTQLIAMGLDGSLDDAFRAATANMANWLETDYKLTPSEIAQILGSAAQYKVSEVADRNAGIVLKIDKARLPQPRP